MILYIYKKNNQCKIKWFNTIRELSIEVTSHNGKCEKSKENYINNFVIGQNGLFL